MKINIASVGEVTLLAYAQQADDGTGAVEGVVLVNRHTNYEPFVTWVLGEHTDGTLAAFWGHYFQDKDAALIDFHQRAETSRRSREAHENVARKARV